MADVRKARIGDLCHMVRGQSPTLKTEPGPYPLVVTAEYRRSSSTYQLEGPAVCVPLISSTGHGHAALHRVHYQEGKFALANLLVALLPRDSGVCDAKYLYHMLMAKKDELLVPLMLGTANVSLKERDIAGVEIALPEVDEQRRIAGRIEELASKIGEARAVSRAAAQETERLLIVMAHRSDLDEPSRAAEGWRRVQLGECIRLIDDLHQVHADQHYPNLGIFSFGRGLFRKPPIDGALTSAKSLRRVKQGQFIYSRLFAFEGAYGSVGPEFDGYFVSNEYPTFECDSAQVRIEFLEAYFRSPDVWKAVAAGSKGLGDRRQRVQPAQVLEYSLWLPPLAWQEKIADVMCKVRQLDRHRDASVAEFDALLPAILDRAFRGQL
jgi:type I restriction enzyme, S subunit